MGHDNGDMEELLTVDQLAAEYDLGRSTVWLHLRRLQVPRYRTPATGKTTLVRRGDWERAMATPVRVSSPETTECRTWRRLGRSRRGGHGGTERENRRGPSVAPETAITGCVQDGRWEVRFTLPNGKSKSIYAKTRQDVQQKHRAALRDLDNGLDLSAGPQTVGQFVAHWLEDVARPTVRASSYRHYEQMLRFHIGP